MWEKPYPSESAGFYAPSAECCRQHPPEMQLSPAAPGLPAGRGCFCSLESPLDGGTAQKVRARNGPELRSQPGKSLDLVRSLRKGQME